LNQIVVQARRGQRWRLTGDIEGMFSKEAKTELSFPNIAHEIAMREKEFYF